MATVSVIIPAYNEMRTIEELLQRVATAPFDKEIVVIDDCSKDGTREYLAELEKEGLAKLKVTPAGKTKLSVLFQPKNGGKGAALQRGFAAASGNIIIVQDADLEYDPHEIPRVIAPIVDGKADVVFGSRFLGETRRVLYYWHSVINWSLTTLSNMTTGLNLTDMETCYKAFRSEVLKGFALQEQRFGIEPELTANVARAKVRVFEVPISYYGRTYEEGKKIGWKDGVRALYVIGKQALKRG
jgi:glycosyltransferase involved in cell wall biosynthesis